MRNSLGPLAWAALVAWLAAGLLFVGLFAGLFVGVRAQDGPPAPDPLPQAGLASPAGCAGRAALDLQGYADAYGAIRTFEHGEGVDPYFATKALLMAHRLGLCINGVGARWVAWLMQRQRLDGRFDRYCHQGRWKRCRAADADDAMAALWLELLAVLAAEGQAMTAGRLSSAERSLALLRSLRNGQRLYDVSAGQPVSLLADNMEVLQALRALAGHWERVGRKAEAARTAREACELAQAINATFWDGSQRQWLPSTQRGLAVAFYPHGVAGLYTVLTPLPGPPGRAADTLAQFMDVYGPAWEAGTADHFPWGLVAVALVENRRADAVRRWLPAAWQARAERRWNVLEEAVLQGLANRDASGPGPAAVAPPC